MNIFERAVNLVGEYNSSCLKSGFESEGITGAILAKESLAQFLNVNNEKRISAFLYNLHNYYIIVYPVCKKT